jgi:hypothetical protein
MFNPFRSARRLRGHIGSLVLAAGVLGSAAAAARMGVDIVYMHFTGAGIVHGLHVYDPVWQRDALNRMYGVNPHPAGIMYPPNTGFITFPLSFLPVRLAQVAWFSILVLAVVVGTRVIVRHVASPDRREDWRLAAGLVLLSACMRWGITPLQCAPLVYGLLCLLVVGLHSDRDEWIFATTCLVLNLKVTLALPFLGLLWLHRRYKLLAAALGVWALLTVVGFARVGGLAAVADYRLNIASMEAITDINTPDPWLPLSIARLDWIYLFYGLTQNLALARTLALALAASVALFLTQEAMRVRRAPNLETTAAFLAPLVYLTLLCVYHHHYDSSLVLVPLILFIFSEPGTAPRTSRWLAVPLLLLITLVPVATTQQLVVRCFGMSKMGVLNMLFPISTSLALAGSLLGLSATVERQSADAATEPRAM